MRRRVLRVCCLVVLCRARVGGQTSGRLRLIPRRRAGGRALALDPPTAGGRRDKHETCQKYCKILSVCYREAGGQARDMPKVLQKPIRSLQRSGRPVHTAQLETRLLARRAPTQPRARQVHCNKTKEIHKRERQELEHRGSDLPDADCNQPKRIAAPTCLMLTATNRSEHRGEG